MVDSHSVPPCPTATSEVWQAPSGWASNVILGQGGAGRAPCPRESEARTRLRIEIYASAHSVHKTPSPSAPRFAASRFEPGVRGFVAGVLEGRPRPPSVGLCIVALRACFQEDGPCGRWCLPLASRLERSVERVPISRSHLNREFPRPRGSHPLEPLLLFSLMIGPALLAAV